MRVRFNVRSICFLGEYRPLGKGMFGCLEGAVLINVEGDACSRPTCPFSTFTSTSREFAEQVANEVMGFVAVPLDELYVAEPGGSCYQSSNVAVQYRFIALPLNCALILAEGEGVLVDSPEFERAAELMAHRGLAAFEGGRLRLIDDGVRGIIVKQVRKIMCREEDMLRRVYGGG